MKLGKALTWEELAILYNKDNNGRSAETLPFSYVFDWAEKQTYIFKVDSKGTIHKIK